MTHLSKIKGLWEQLGLSGPISVIRPGLPCGQGWGGNFSRGPPPQDNSVGSGEVWVTGLFSLCRCMFTENYHCSIIGIKWNRNIVITVISDHLSHAQGRGLVYFLFTNLERRSNGHVTAATAHHHVSKAVPPVLEIYLKLLSFPDTGNYANSLSWLEKQIKLLICVNHSIQHTLSIFLWNCDMAGLLHGTFVSWWYLPRIWPSVIDMQYYYHARYPTDDWHLAYMVSLVYFSVEVCLEGVFPHSISTRQDSCVRVYAPLTLAPPSMKKKPKSNRGWPSSPLEPSEGAFELTHGSACIIGW